MPTLLHPDDPAFHRMVTAFEGKPEPWLTLNRALRDALVSYAVERAPYYRPMAGRPFEEFPILTKGTVRSRYQDLLAEGIHRDRWAPGRTSGSVGQPMAFVRDTAQGSLENISARRFLRWMHGVPPQATTVWVASRPVGRPRARPPGPGGLLGRRPDPEVHPVTTMTLTPKRLERETRAWARFRSWFLYGHSSAIAWIADQVQRRGLPVPNNPICVVTTSELLTEHASERIQRTFPVPVHSWYGSNEMNGFVAGTLPGTRRYALNPLLVFPEVLDGEGRPAPAGEPGRLILTDLNNLVMPFIRYDTDDVAVASSEGSMGGFPVIDALAGRSGEALRLPSGKILNGVTLGQALFVMNDLVAEVAFYQCARVGPNELELRVVWDRPPTPERERALASAARSASDPDTAVRIRAVERLGLLPSGKAWIVRDETGETPAEQPTLGST